MAQSTESIAIFIFYNIASGVQAALSFSKTFKHCNVVTYDGKDWILVDFDRTGMLMRCIKCHDGSQFVRSLRLLKEVISVISVNISKRHSVCWKPWWVRSCNEICRYVSGINLGFTFNPMHFYTKLLKYDGKRNYEILSHWRR